MISRVNQRSTIVFTLAALVVICAGIKVAQPLVVPCLLAIFITMLCTPLMLQLQRLNVPIPIAVVLIVIVLLLGFVVFMLLFGSVFNAFLNDLPELQKQLEDKTQHILEALSARGFAINQSDVWQYLNPSSAMRLVSDLMSALSGALANIFFIFLTVILILLEIPQFAGKLKQASANPKEMTVRWQRILAHTNHYVIIKTLLSILTGILVSVWLYIIDVDHPMLWGLFAFLLNYIPNIGSILSAIPAALLGLLDQGFMGVFLVISGYAVINIVIGNFLEPKLMGRTLGLSTLIVFLSLVFWGWLLGPVGMLLSAPMTMVLKIILSSRDQTRWLAVWLGSDAYYMTNDEKQNK